MIVKGVNNLYPDEIDLATFIVERWKQVGVGHVFGVPGDFNLNFLDYVESDSDINWVGCSSELGAGYAIDGYARAKSSLSVLVTTMGVGEASAIAALLGIRSERYPAFHLCGVPSTAAFTNRALLHHTLGNGDLTIFERMWKEACGEDAAIVLGVGIQPETDYPGVIDRLIRLAMNERRPVYLGLPMDLVTHKVPSQSLMNSLNLSPFPPPVSALQVPSQVIDQIVAVLDKAKEPVLVADFYADRFGYQDEVRQLADLLGFRTFGTTLAKTLLDEQSPRYQGIYAGKISNPDIRSMFEGSDCCLIVGKLESDFNTGMFSSVLPNNTIEINMKDTVVYDQIHPVGISDILPALISVLQKRSLNGGISSTKGVEMGLDGNGRPGVTRVDGSDNIALTHEVLWPRFEKFLRDGDTIVADIGTSSLGLLDIKFPSEARLHVQHLWGAIGWAGGAVLGAGLALRERLTNRPSRTMIVIGDGGFQMTLQEMGTMIRNRLPLYYFINNNDGYEIERQIHGPRAKYNDIQTYDHQLLVRALAGPLFDGFCETYKIMTLDALDRLLDDTEFNTPNKFRMVELCLPRGDAPAGLIRLTAKKVQ